MPKKINLQLENKRLTEIDGIRDFVITYGVKNVPIATKRKKKDKKEENNCLLIY